MDKIKGTLFLKGVFKENCLKIEDIFEERLIIDDINDLYQIEKQSINYDKIPVNFSGFDTWLKSTNLLCNYCTCSIDDVPWFEPQTLNTISMGKVGVLYNEKVKQKYIFSTKGVFCSVYCVNSHIKQHTKNLNDRIDKNSMLKILYKIFNNAEITNIKLAPDYLLMEKFGGNITCSEYKNMINDLKLSDNELKKQ